MTVSRPPKAATLWSLQREGWQADGPVVKESWAFGGRVWLSGLHRRLDIIVQIIDHSVDRNCLAEAGPIREGDS